MTRKKIFDYVIGNPPYQDESVGKQKKYAPPIYDDFLDAAIQVGTKVEMIHPARFLFNAGGTPKSWNLKMLNDPHFKVLKYKQDSREIFPNVDIKGGIAITYRDNTQNFGAIKIFTSFPELNSILEKVYNTPKFTSFRTIMMNRGLYRFSAKAYADHPKELEKLSDSRIGAGVFEHMPDLFTEKKPQDNYTYAKFLGLLHTKRVYRWFRLDYFKTVETFQKYKVFLPAANGSGALGEVMSTPLIGEPLIGVTETFLSIGSFDRVDEAEHCLKYIKTKFARAMLGILKITQHNSPDKWQYVPLQDFTAKSDIDWSKSIHEIDHQLYTKYGLSADEIKFIESHVKEMK